ncbi:MAG: outer membrane beta-barrel protein [Candidatus Aminicenantes bacterium]|nr:outer membrane beta-barrel protein [Candidatus Aminicenantes bacterium]
MKKVLRAVLFLAVAAALVAVPAQAQMKLDFSLFGGYGFNMSFASTVTTTSAFSSGTAGYWDAWQPFFHDPVLELKAGPSFGGRVTLWFTPMIGFEGSFEYSLAKPRFNEVNVADLEAQMDDIGYTSYFTITPEGGHLMKFYGNIIFNLMPSAQFSPYLTAGIGSTSYTIEPAINITHSGYSELMNLSYDNASALTFNGGAGFNYWFSPMIGLRVDARMFFASPKFLQNYDYKIFGSVDWPTDNYVTQSGSHMDAVITVGLVIRVM